jgi:hypothetical protein
MPHKPVERIEGLVIPSWVDGLGDECLRDTVLEALIAKHDADKAGVDPRADKDPCASAYRSGEETLAQIKHGRYDERQACRRAATAVRKYNTARECALPTARRKP